MNPATARRAVFFDLAGTLFSARDLRDSHLAQLRAVADAVGVTASDDEVRAAYRHGVGVAYRAIAARPSYLDRELFGSSFAAMAEALGGSLDTAERDALVDLQYASTLDADARPGADDGGADFVIERLADVVELVDQQRAA
jgi:hypothetical protein